jgi:hypothetical protein
LQTAGGTAARFTVALADRARNGPNAVPSRAAVTAPINPRVSFTGILPYRLGRETTKLWESHNGCTPIESSGEQQIPNRATSGPIMPLYSATHPATVESRPPAG